MSWKLTLSSQYEGQANWRSRDAIVKSISTSCRSVEWTRSSAVPADLNVSPDVRAAMAEERIIYGRVSEEGIRLELRLPVLEPIESVELEITSERDPILYLRRLCLQNDWSLVDPDTNHQVSLDSNSCREWRELSGSLELMLGTWREVVRPTLDDVRSVMDRMLTGEIGREDFEIRSIQNSECRLIIMLALPMDDTEPGWIVHHGLFVLSDNDFDDETVERMVCGCPHQVLRRAIVPYEKAIDVIRYSLRHAGRSPEFTWIRDRAVIA